MNHQESDDWREIAHGEYENRKNMELQLTRVNSALGQLKQNLATSTNYNLVLEKKVTELERESAAQKSKLNRSLELLKDAKLLFSKRKEEVENLLRVNAQLQIDFQQEIQLLSLENEQLKNEKQQIKEELIRKTTLLDAEIMHHQQTNQKLAQALTKLTAQSATYEYQRLSMSDTIYAEAAQTYEAEENNNTKEGLISRLFSAYSSDRDIIEEEYESDFIEPMPNFEKQSNK